MIQAYDCYNHSHDKAPAEVDEYCRLEGVSPLYLRRSIAMKVKAESKQRHHAFRRISITLKWLGKRMSSAIGFRTSRHALSAFNTSVKEI